LKSLEVIRNGREKHGPNQIKYFKVADIFT